MYFSRREKDLNFTPSGLNKQCKEASSAENSLGSGKKKFARKFLANFSGKNDSGKLLANLRSLANDGWKFRIHKVKVKDRTYIYLKAWKYENGKQKEKSLGRISSDLVEKLKSEGLLAKTPKNKPHRKTSTITTTKHGGSAKGEAKKPDLAMESHLNSLRWCFVGGGGGFCWVGLHGVVLFVGGVLDWGVVDGWFSGVRRGYNGALVRMFSFVFPSTRFRGLEGYSRVVRFELYPRTGNMRVFISADKDPLDLEEWFAVKTLIIKYLRKFYRQIGEIKVLRYEISKDQKTRKTVNIPKGLTVTLEEFSGILEKTYIKEINGEKIVREETISQKPCSLEEMEQTLIAKTYPAWAIAKTNQLEKAIAQTNKNINQLANTISGIVVILNQLKDIYFRISKLEERMFKLEEKTRNQQVAPTTPYTNGNGTTYNQLPGNIREALKLLEETNILNTYIDRVEYGALTWRYIRKNRTLDDRFFRIVKDLLAGEKHAELALKILKTIKFLDNRDPALEPKGLKGVTYQTLLKYLEK